MLRLLVLLLMLLVGVEVSSHQARHNTNRLLCAKWNERRGSTSALIVSVLNKHGCPGRCVRRLLPSLRLVMHRAVLMVLRECSSGCLIDVE